MSTALDGEDWTLGTLRLALNVIFFGLLAGAWAYPILFGAAHRPKLQLRDSLRSDPDQFWIITKCPCPTLQSLFHPVEHP
jgi:hypothetical protein